MMFTVRSLFSQLVSDNADMGCCFPETSIEQVLPFAIKTLKEAGYSLVTVAECLGEKPYHSVGQPQERTVGNFCSLIPSY